MVGLECEPKRTLGAAKIVHLVKDRLRVEALLAKLREDGDRRQPAEITFTAVRRRGGTEERTEHNLKVMLDEGAALEAHEHHCFGCPVNVSQHPYGCHGYIQYPIRRSTEAFLLSLLPPRLDTTAGRMLTSALADLGWDGSYAAKLRAEGDSFFEAREPPAATWGDGAKVTSDQVFQMLFGLGPLDPSHAMMLLLFFGMIAHDTPPADLAALSRDPARLMGRLEDSPLRVPSGDPQIESMVRFLQALAAAAVNSVTLLVDS